MPTENIHRPVDRKWNRQTVDTYCNGIINDSGVGVYANINGQTVFLKYRQWVRTPNFRQLVANKQPVPENAFYFRQQLVGDTEIFSSAQTVTAVCTGPTPTLSTRTERNWIPTTIWGPGGLPDSHTDAALRAKLVSKAKDAEWSVPTFIGEGRQTVQMIANTARTIGSAYRDLRRGNLLGALGSLGIQGNASQRRRYYREFGVDPSRAAANQWLALTYGWRPLVQDVYNAAETLAETALDLDNQVMRVTASTRYRDQRTFRMLMGVSPLIFATCKEITEQSFKGVWKFKPTSLNSWGSFGLLNPASVAWELLPFSFVVDWFLPVGRYLEGLDVPMRFNHLGGTIGEKRKNRRDWSDWSVHDQPASGSHFAQDILVQRTPLSGPPVGSLSDIRFEPKLGAARATSAIALMSQIFRR